MAYSGRLAATHGSRPHRDTGSAAHGSSYQIPSASNQSLKQQHSRRHHSLHSKMSAPIYHYYLNNSYMPEDIPWRYHSRHLRHGEKARDSDQGGAGREKEREHRHGHEHRHRHRHHGSRHMRSRSRGEDGLAASDTAEWSSHPDQMGGTAEGSSGLYGDWEAALAEGGYPLIRRRDNVTVEDVKHQKEERHKHEQSIRSALSDLAARSTDVTRRLDNAYYNLLEKISNMHSAIYSFEDLSALVSNLHRDFGHETSGLGRDARKQIDDVDGFSGQIRRVEDLEGRMRKGVSRAQQLRKRLEVAEEKINAWDQREGEWQARMTRRLRIFWAVVVIIVVVVGVILALDRISLPQPTLEISGTNSVIDSDEQLANVSFQDIAENISRRQDQAPLDAHHRRRHHLEQQSLGLSWDDDDATAEEMCTATGTSSVDIPSPTFSPVALEEPLQRVIDEL